MAVSPEKVRCKNYGMMYILHWYGISNCGNFQPVSPGKAKKMRRKKCAKTVNAQ